MIRGVSFMEITLGTLIMASDLFSIGECGFGIESVHFPGKKSEYILITS